MKEKDRKQRKKEIATFWKELMDKRASSRQVALWSA
jgi:hypothetical protein